MIAGTIGVTLLAAAALRGVLRRFEIREASMAPTLESGDWVIAKRRTGPPSRGDIVVFDDRTGTGMNLVKRVIGIAGEQVGIDNGRVTVDGSVLADRWASGVTAPDGQWDVPEGHIWVLGDNRSASRSDSRLYGSIPIESVQWQVVARYWPPATTGTVD
jgi:signal peptidase I